MKKATATILALLIIFPIIFTSCETTDTLPTQTTSLTAIDITLATELETPVLGLPLCKIYGGSRDLNIGFDFLQLTILTYFRHKDPESNIFEIEFNAELLKRSDRPDIPKIQFRTPKLILNTREEDINIDGKRIDADISSDSKNWFNHSKRYTFDMNGAPKGDYTLTVKFGEQTIEFPFAVTVADKLEFASVIADELSYSGFNERIDEKHRPYFRAEYARYIQDDDILRIFYRLHLHGYSTSAGYQADVNIGKRKLVEGVFKDNDDYSYCIDRLSAENILEAETALLEQVNKYLLSHGEKTYTLEEAREKIFHLSCNESGNIKLETELIINAKEGEDAPCGDHWHAMFSQNINLSPNTN